MALRVIDFRLMFSISCMRDASPLLMRFICCNAASPTKMVPTAVRASKLRLMNPNWSECYKRRVINELRRLTRRHRDVTPETFTERLLHPEGRLSLPSTRSLPRLVCLVNND